MNEADDRVWKALADPVRRSLLDALRSGPRTTGDLCALFAQTRFGVMKHLDVLVAAQLVTVERRGRERWNHLNGAAFELAMDRWLTPFQRLWSSQLTRLSHLLQEESAVSEAFETCVEIRQEVELPFPPERVFRALTEQVGKWWTAPFRQAGADSRLDLEARIGAPMIERGAGGHEVIWAQIEEIQPSRRLYLSGRLAMVGAVAGRIHYDLEPTAAGTRLTLVHTAVGRLTEEVRQTFVQGWAELLTRRLPAHLEGREDD